MRNVLPAACLSKLYFAFIQPHLLYGIEVYANAYKTSLDKLCKLNNKLLRILLYKNITTPTNELYAAMNVLPIPILHEMQLLTLIHKWYYHKGSLPEIFQNYFTLNNCVHHYNTRRDTHLHVPVGNTTFGQRCTAYRGGKLWNSLPEYLKINMSLAVFKKKMFKYLLERT